jgi:hypothetical protein
MGMIPLFKLFDAFWVDVEAADFIPEVGKADTGNKTYIASSNYANIHGNFSPSRFYFIRR